MGSYLVHIYPVYIPIKSIRGCNAYLQVCLSYDPVERERERRKTLFIHCNLYLQLRDIYIYKARSPNYHTCDLY